MSLIGPYVRKELWQCIEEQAQEFSMRARIRGYAIN